MSRQEKAVTKALRRHQRDGRRFRDLLIHCACGWKSPELKARKGSNDFAAAREDQAKSFERHVTKAVIEAAGIAPDDSITGTAFGLNVKLVSTESKTTMNISISSTDDLVLACIAMKKLANPEYIRYILYKVGKPVGWVDA